MKITVVKAAKPAYESVEIREPVYRDIRRALETSGLGMGDLGLASLPTLIAHLIHECATFDGKRLPPDEIEEMPISFFFEALASLGLSSESVEVVKASLATTPTGSQQA